MAPSTRWQDAVLDLQDEQQRAHGDLERRRQESSGLAAEVAKLREQLEREKAETSAVVLQYSRKIENVVHENKRLQTKLMRTQLRESAKESEVAVVKKEVLEKTMAIEKVMRDLQQQQQATLERVENVATVMLASCKAGARERTGRSGSVTGTPARQLSVDSAASVNGDLLSGLGLATNGASFRGATPPNGRTGSVVSIGSRRSERVIPTLRPQVGIGDVSSSSQISSPVKDGGESPEGDVNRWLQTVKGNLEHFGDVEVLIDNSTRDCSCCLEPMTTPYRIRPRRCHHIFHIECLLQWWTEGTCPVCSVSFAPTPGGPGIMRDPAQPASSDGRRAQVQNNGGRGAADSRSASPLLSRPAGLPGPGSFGGADVSLGSPMGQLSRQTRPS